MRDGLLQVSDEQAALFAANVLSNNKGSLGATIQELLHSAISQSRLGSVMSGGAGGGGGSMVQAAPAPQQQQRHMAMDQNQVWLGVGSLNVGSVDAPGACVERGVCGVE